MRRLLVLLLAFLTVSALGAVPSMVPATGAPGPRPFPETIGLPDGFQPEGVTSGRGPTFWVGSLADGAIYRGDVRSGAGAVLVPGQDGMVAVGTEYDPRTRRLWVAGGPTGQVRAYDGGTGELLGSWDIPGAGFLNDLTVTRTGVYVTDSFVPQLVRIPTSGGLGAGAQVLPLTGDIAYGAGFNANGIEDARGGRVLFLIQTNTGTLFAVHPRTGETTAVDTGGVDLTRGDGLLLTGNRLHVVRNSLNEIAVLKLRRDGGGYRATLVDTLTDPDFDIPTTVTKAAGRLYAVNARFGTAPTPTTPYDVVRVDR